MAEESKGTPFSAIYNVFLGKITDDMYMELTPEDTIKDLRNLLVNAIPLFEFPKVALEDYTIESKEIDEDQVEDGDFVLSIEWHELDEDKEKNVVVERSCFASTLSAEEINILAVLMKQGWVSRQVASIEVTRMKYSGSDFKMTSQANHLAKLLSLLEEVKTESLHLQRLYKRRAKRQDGSYGSSWTIFR